LKSSEITFTDHSLTDKSHSYKASFDKKTKITSVKVFFNEQNQVMYKLDAYLKADGNIVRHVQLHDQEFGRYAYSKKANTQKGAKTGQSYEPLTLLCNFEATEFELSLHFGNTCFSIGKGKALPESLIEIYGENPQSDEEIAQKAMDYKEVKTNFQKNKDKLMAVTRQYGSSIPFLCMKGENDKEVVYLPCISDEDGPFTDIKLTKKQQDQEDANKDDEE
jgi:hypothetical protein